MHCSRIDNAMREILRWRVMTLLWTKRKIYLSKKVIIFYNFLRLRLSLLNVSMSNYSRHDCSINPTPWTRLNFTIDDLRALISRSRVVSTFFAMSCSGLRGPPLLATRYCGPEPWLFINHSVVSMTDWVTDGRREVLYTYGVRAKADARRGDLSRLW